MRTFSPKATEITRAWHVIDANDIPLGRIASAAATILRGKHKAIFAPQIALLYSAFQTRCTGDR